MLLILMFRSRCFRTLFGDQFWRNKLRGQLGQELQGVLKQLQLSAQGLQARLATQLRSDPLVKARQEKTAYGYSLRDCLEALAGSGFKESVVHRYPDCIDETATMSNETAPETTPYHGYGVWLKVQRIFGQLFRRAKQPLKRRCTIQLADVYACVISRRVLFVSKYPHHVDTLRRLLEVADAEKRSSGRQR